EPSLRRLQTSRRITSSYESAKNNPIAITYRTITCAGSRRDRFSLRSVRLRTSSSRSRPNRADTTPNPMWSVNRPHGRDPASTAADVTASHRTGLHNRRQLTTLTSTDALSERHWGVTDPRIGDASQLAGPARRI